MRNFRLTYKLIQGCW